MSEAQEYPPPSEPLAQRIPDGLTKLLGKIWSKHTRQTNPLEEHYGDNVPFRHLAGQFGLSVEYLTRIGLITLRPGVLDQDGKLIKTVSTDELDDVLVKDKPFSPISVFVLGGSEGRVFAEMGANVIALNPFSVKFPLAELDNLQELTDELDGNFANHNVGKFDLTFSSRVFDRGSGLTSSGLGFSNYFKMLMDMTKQRGLGVHNGDAMPAIARDLNLKVKEIAPVHESDIRTHFFATIYVVQKR